MTQRLGRALGRGALALALAALCTPALARKPVAKASPAAAIQKWQKVQTWGWRAEIPAGWKQWLKEKNVDEKPYDGKWGFRSPNKNFRLRVKVRIDQGLSWKEVTKTTYLKLFRRFPEFKLLRANTVKVGGRPLFYLLGSAKVVRKKKERDYLIFRMMTRAPKRKLRVAATLLVADEKIDNLIEVIERFLDTFELVDISSAELALKKLRK